MIGIVDALQTVVTVRGYSRICGATSLEMLTGMSSLRTSASSTARSFDGLA